MQQQHWCNVARVARVAAEICSLRSAQKSSNEQKSVDPSAPPRPTTEQKSAEKSLQGL
jgi:hypothetical protein